MIVTAEQVQRMRQLAAEETNVAFFAFLAQNPQLLMATGFDEVAYCPATKCTR